MYNNMYPQYGLPMQPTQYAQRFNQYSQPKSYDNLIRVTGIEGARAYQMPPNSTAVLFDGSQDIMYVKTTDGAGFPSIRQFLFTPMQDKPKAQFSSDLYVTRKQFEELKEMIQNGKQPIRKSAKQDSAE